MLLSIKKKKKTPRCFPQADSPVPTYVPVGWHGGAPSAPVASTPPPPQGQS